MNRKVWLKKGLLEFLFYQFLLTNMNLENRLNGYFSPVK